MYKESHPFEELIPKGAKGLIVGSFPPVRLTVKDPKAISGKNKDAYVKYLEGYDSDGDIDFYYGSKENSFWSIISKAFNIKPELDSSIRIRKFLEDNLLGITDIVQKCTRVTSSGGVGSSDDDLQDIEYRDVVKTIKINKIQKVYCTSDFVLRKLKKIIKEAKDNVLTNSVELIKVPSPSRNYYRTKSRNSGYLSALAAGTVRDIDEYRVKVYKNEFGVK